MTTSTVFLLIILIITGNPGSMNKWMLETGWFPNEELCIKAEIVLHKMKADNVTVYTKCLPLDDLQ